MTIEDIKIGKMYICHYVREVWSDGASNWDYSRTPRKLLCRIEQECPFTVLEVVHISDERRPYLDLRILTSEGIIGWTGTFIDSLAEASTI